MTSTPSLLIRHSTYFKLADGTTPAGRDAYVAACQAYLSAFEGLMSFSVGHRAEDIAREVSDTAFDVAMHQVFQDTEAFKNYNSGDPRHEQFVDEVDRWAPGTTRRVLDSFLSNLSYAGDANPSGAVTPGESQRLRHCLYFKLKDSSPKSVASFKEICLRLLTNHDGQSLFAMGECANPLGRDINVQNFDVSADSEWLSQEQFEAYTNSARHKEFFPETEGTIETTQVFDSRSTRANK